MLLQQQSEYYYGQSKYYCIGEVSTTYKKSFENLSLR